MTDHRDDGASDKEQAFWSLTEDLIDIANQKSETQEAGLVSDALLYAAARFADGAEAFVGRYGTLVVWAHPDAASHDVELVPTAVGGNVTGRVEEIDGQEIGWLLTDARGYLPQDILFHTDHDVWTAGGVPTASLRGYGALPRLQVPVRPRLIPRRAGLGGSGAAGSDARVTPTSAWARRWRPGRAPSCPPRPRTPMPSRRASMPRPGLHR